MRRLVAACILCILPLIAFAHPGKTDYVGGHKCLKRCEDWGLLYGEYHLHDKNGRAIRIAKKKHAKHDAIRTVATETAPLVTGSTRTITVYRYVTNIYEESIFSSNPLLWVLLILLSLVLILRRTRREFPKK